MQKLVFIKYLENRQSEGSKKLPSQNMQEFL